jgi:uncharacterized protein YaaW (UPF0174 family)
MNHDPDLSPVLNAMHCSPDFLPAFQALAVDVLKLESDTRPSDVCSAITRAGGHSAMNVLRDGGASYTSIVRNVAAAVKAPISDDATVVEMEQAIVEKLVAEYFQDLPDEDRKEISKMLKSLGKECSPTGLLQALSIGGVVMASVARKLAVALTTRVVASVVARFAGIQAAKTAGRAVGAAVPFLNIALAAWTVHDLAGPAMRKTVPSVFTVGVTRMQLGNLGETA